MSTIFSVAGIVAVWTAFIQAGFVFGIADGAFWVKFAFALAIIGAIASQRPNSTQAWLEGLNR